MEDSHKTHRYKYIFLLYKRPRPLIAFFKHLLYIVLYIMLAIKLQRIGKKNQPSYRIVVQPKRSKLGGRYIDDLGWYHPITKKAEILVNRVDYWIKNGAKPTPTVHNLLVREKALKAPKIPIHKAFVKKEEAKTEETKA